MVVSAPLHRVFFDGNDGTHESGYWLGFEQSRADLGKIGADLHDGLRVLLVSPGEFEIEADLKFDRDGGCWLGFADDRTIRYLDGSDVAQ